MEYENYLKNTFNMKKKYQQYIEQLEKKKCKKNIENTQFVLGYNQAIKDIAKELKLAIIKY